jgi:hypothetical protein
VTAAGHRVEVATARLGTKSTYRVSTKKFGKGSFRIVVSIAATTGNAGHSSKIISIKRT